MRIMEKIYLDENIYYIKDIVPSDALSRINAYMKNEDVWQNELGQGSWKNNICPGPEFVEDRVLWQDIFDMTKLVEEVISSENSKVDRSKNLSRFRTTLSGKEWAMDPHHDSPQPYTAGGVVLYLNDEFDGGEIEYINKGIKFKPIPGAVVFHPASKEYTHGVRRVDNGTRYMVTMFTFEDKYFDLKRSMSDEDFRKHMDELRVGYYGF